MEESMSNTIAGLTPREYHRRYYYKRRAKLIALLGDRCEWCGTKDDLQFDHIDPAEKWFNISENMTANNRVVRAELAKCQLLCRECHIEKTAAERIEAGFTHGTTYAWRNLNCRCEICVVARDEYNAQRREKRRTGARRAYGRPSTHGEHLHYRRGCRCDECRVANTAHQRKLREKKAA